MLFVGMQVGSAGYAEETFTVHKIVEFGMTREQVIAAELSMGNELAAVDDGITLRSKFMSLAGQEDGYIDYVFDGDSLCKCVYVVPVRKNDIRKKYNEISSALQRNYGTPVYSSLSGDTLLLPAVYSGIPRTAQEWLAAQSYSYKNDDTFQYEQWLVPAKDWYVLITHTSAIYNVPDYGEAKTHTVYYVGIDAKVWDAFMNTVQNKREEMDSDL